MFNRWRLNHKYHLVTSWLRLSLSPLNFCALLSHFVPQCARLTPRDRFPESVRAASCFSGCMTSCDPTLRFLPQLWTFPPLSLYFHGTQANSGSNTHTNLFPLIPSHSLPCLFALQLNLKNANYLINYNSFWCCRLQPFLPNVANIWINLSDNKLFGLISIKWRGARIWGYICLV